MAHGLDPHAEWDGVGPRPRKLVPGTLGSVGVGAGPIGKSGFTAAMNFHSLPEGHMDKESLAGSGLFMQTLSGACRGNDVLLPGLGYKVEGADGLRLWVATHEVRFRFLGETGGWMAGPRRHRGAALPPCVRLAWALVSSTLKLSSLKRVGGDNSSLPRLRFSALSAQVRHCSLKPAEEEGLIRMTSAISLNRGLAGCFLKFRRQQ